ncbi:MAG: hypothetical protein WD971_02180 [Pirellulales bacterium]
MKRQLWTVIALLVSPQLALAQSAVEAISYNAGTTAVPGYNDLAAPLGAPANTNGSNPFEGVVSPFNPPYKANDLLSVGENGHLTLRLSNYVLPQALSREIGVFTNVGLADADYPNGQADAGPFTFGVDSALVEVSENGTSWASLGSVTFDIPANAYTDLTNPFSLTNGSEPADFQQPFTGSLSDFANKTYAGASPNILELLDGSAGGTWLDISAAGLAQVGFIRFTVPENLAANVSLELDAVSIARDAIGAPTVPEPVTAVLLGTALLGLVFRLGRLRAH